mgnify:FL=1
MPQDYAEAGKWYRKAAEQDIAPAQYNLRVIYLKGRGVSQDYAEAFKWYSKAAEQGHASAQYSLGLMYAREDGVPRDYTEAYFWFSLASKRGSKKAAKTMNMVSQLLPKNEISTVDQRVAAWRSKKTEPRKSARPSLPARKMETPSITKDNDAEINGDVEARLQQLKRIYEQGLIEK